ncbi:isocitrate lyase/phosphoenolpyruvate mutase family protein [Collimonas pratensis]|uniref:isocitrate lyase/PEP mutase family protein n=1 Tax=Collimonas pratensis TaxID=279113 RepID=UPI00143DEA9F|nr:isocitrate lyase/phosphoenolpyruvate mutase family protein [Collimonas pratensis]NKI69272.1 isocitrate lyase/phosphoenolpyruvate mutase family protein [Collimonas pratensis]
MRSQIEKARIFQRLHAREGAFIIPNPWDIGSAKLLTLLGFEALASTSAGYAFSRGLTDGAIGREQMMAHLKELAAATDLPLSADLENGWGDSPGTVAETIRLAAAAGIVGGSIEDASGQPDDPIYSLKLAVERMRAAVEAARSLDFPFTLTARAENFLVGRADLKDTIKRLQAYQDAGADVLYAPGLKSREDIAAVVGALDKPVNVVMGLQGVQLSLQELAQIGVKRVSVGGSLARAALGAFLRAAEEMRDHGTFSYGNEAVGTRQISEMLLAANKL